jgi:hypothetical protein
MPKDMDEGGPPLVPVPQTTNGCSRWRTALASAALGAALTGCGTSLTVKSTLVVAMYGVFVAPADAAGDSEPKYQDYTLEGVTLTAEDGTETELYSDDPKDLRIVSRSQIIHEADVSDHEDDAFTKIAVTFAPDISGEGTTGDELTTTLAVPTATLETPFTIEQGKERRLKIAVQWKNTVTYDSEQDPAETMSPPTFALSFGDED